MLQEPPPHTSKALFAVQRGTQIPPEQKAFAPHWLSVEQPRSQRPFGMHWVSGGQTDAPYTRQSGMQWPPAGSHFHPFVQVPVMLEQVPTEQGWLAEQVSRLEQ